MEDDHREDGKDRLSQIGKRGGSPLTEEDQVLDQFLPFKEMDGKAVAVVDEGVETAG